MWIDEYRRAHGLEWFELAWMCDCGEFLLYMIDRCKWVTHPVIADRIAEVCGATPEQRDQIVPERHRGTWAMPAKPYRREGVMPSPTHGLRAQTVEEMLAQQAAIEPARRAVVRVDRDGAELDRYDSVQEATLVSGKLQGYIVDRCRRRIKQEFRRGPDTFRWADEWDTMNAAQRADDLTPSKRHKGATLKASNAALRAAADREAAKALGR